MRSGRGRPIDAVAGKAALERTLSKQGGGLAPDSKDVASALRQDSPPLAQGTVPRHVSHLAAAAAKVGNGPVIGASIWIAIIVAIRMAIGSSWDSVPILADLFIGFCIFVGLILALQGYVSASRSVHLVREGVLSWARVTDVKKVIVRTRDTDGDTRTRTRYDVSYAYLVAQHEVRYGRISVASTKLITDESYELVLYATENPDLVEFVDFLPAGLRLDTHGNASASLAHSLVAVVPFLIVIGIPAIAYFGSW